MNYPTELCRCLPILACFEIGSVYPYIYLSIDLYLPIAIYIHTYICIYILSYYIYILLYIIYTILNIYNYILHIIYYVYIYIYISEFIYTIHIPSPSPKVLHPRPSHLLVVKANPQALMLVEPIWEMKAKLRPRVNMKRGQGCI
jgi:hypothetical protein